MHNIQCCHSTLHISPSKSSPQHSAGITRTRLVNIKGTKFILQLIIEFLGFCLHNTYFLLQGKYYVEVEEVAMESLVSPIIANIYIQHFKDVALKTVENPPRLVKRFVDDTFVIQCREHSYTTLTTYTKQFPIENTQVDGYMLFLDTLLTLEQNRTLSISVYRKPTHTTEH